MAKSVQASLPPMELHSLDSGRTSMDRNRTDGSESNPDASIRMTAVVKEALIEHYGKLEVAALLMRKMDPSQLSRELRDGTFKFDRLDALDAEGKAAVTNALSSVFGKPDDPLTRVRRLIREAKQKLADAEAAVA
jgi:hypothetical protein